jgi:hypothetical protein
MIIGTKEMLMNAYSDLILQNQILQTLKYRLFLKLKVSIKQLIDIKRPNKIKILKT